MFSKAIIDFKTITTASLRVPQFETAINEPIDDAFGEQPFEETSAGHFYSDDQTMAADRTHMMGMCHTEGHDNFSDHIIATHLGEFGEIDE